MKAIRPQTKSRQSAINGEQIVGRIEGGWAYEMDLVLQDGCWVVAQLRVFPNRGEVLQAGLLTKIRMSKFLGDVDRAASLEQQLAQLAQKQKQPASLPPGGLTARHLRRISFGTRSGLATFNEIDDRVGNMVAAVLRRQKSSNRGNARLAHVAQCYVEALRQRSRRPNADVARQLKMKPSQVRDAVFPEPAGRNY